MTNPCKAFTSGSLSSWEVSGKMSRGKAASTSPDRLGRCSPNGVASNGYGSLSLHGDGGYRCSSYSSFSIDGRLLAPVHLDIDPDFQAMRQQEKEDIKLLNNQFVTLIEKVQCLEQQNKILTTRWNFLKDQDNSHSESDIKAIYDQYMSKMNQEMKALNYEQENLESELTKVLSTMDNFRSKYEDEIRLCSGMEYTFMELKKDLDVSSLHRTELQVKLNGLQELMDLKKTIYEQSGEGKANKGYKCFSKEIRALSTKGKNKNIKMKDTKQTITTEVAATVSPDTEAELSKDIFLAPPACRELEELLTEIKDISVVLGIDNACKLDLSRIVEEVRAQYEALALRSWEEAEALTRRKLSEGSTQSSTYGGHLLDSRREIADLNIQIQKLRSCIVSQKSQCLYLEEHIKEAGEHGEMALKDAKAKLVKLEEALQKSKEDMAHLVKEYQELMNIKLALDVEILTYRKLMEGEESSMEQPIPTIVSAVHSRPKHLSASTLRNSKLFAQGTGSTNSEVKPSGGSTKVLPTRSHSDNSADTFISSARPKLSSLPTEECS